MTARSKPTSPQDLRTILKSELGYEWEKPTSPTAPQHVAFWQLAPLDSIKAMTDELVEIEWRIAHLRSHIETLGLRPKGRTRQSLAEQLSAAFLNPARMAKAVSQLGEEERRYYAYILLQSSLRSCYVAPQMRNLFEALSTPWSTLAQRIINAGLALKAEEGELFLPFSILRALPRLAIPVPKAPEPAQFVPAEDPRELMTHIQQALGLLQAKTLKLRERPRWRAPKYAYAQPVVSWPPVPADAETLTTNVERERRIELLAPPPYLDETASKTLRQALDVSQTMAEFVYQVMAASGVIWSGSPVTIDTETAHAWMALTPGRQVSAIYGLYRILAPWAYWWSQWRADTLHLHWSYQGYWSLISIDESVMLSSSNLRWVLLDLLSFLPPERWIDIDDLFGLLDRFFPDHKTHRYLMGLQPEHEQLGWSGFLRTVLIQMLTGPLRLLGLVDVGPSLQDVRTVRLRGMLQDLHWERVQEMPLQATETVGTGAVRLIPQSIVTKDSASEPLLEVTTPVAPDFLTFLLRWTKPAGFSKQRMRYQLDVQRLHQAFEQGEDPASLTESWRTRASSDPPPEIVAWWQVWWDRYGHVRLYTPQSILQTRDAFTMQELQVALPGLQASINGMLTPHAAILKDEDVDGLLEDLARQGYMPRET